ncbi:MAG: hypothetical protein HC845_15120 [Akkermansiaceae bacterium]|nr:hypothetical protein [Akkermansiaceae bacterium]
MVSLQRLARAVDTGMPMLPLLNQSSAQTYTVSYEQGSGATGSLTWQATNVMDAETLTIRLGDTLLLGAWGS